MMESKKKGFISKSLFKQSLKANFVLWLILTIGCAFIFIIINLVVGTKTIFTNINMEEVTTYVNDENLQWLQILGLLSKMGFSLSRIQTMSQIDINSVMNDLIYKIAGVLLPMIYVIIVSNKLIASQVSDGSMAYVLSTPTNRKTVLKTQYCFLVSSIVLMYLVITVSAYLSGMLAFFINPPHADSANFVSFSIRTLLYCLGSMIAIIGLSGICFGASAWFNKSNQSIAVGGGVGVLCFICCILGLFGNKVFVSLGLGVQAMDAFNYITLFTLIDTESMSLFAKGCGGIMEGVINFDWLWKIAILLAIGILGAYIGAKKFIKKDLPL